MLSTKSWMHSIHPTSKLKYHLANPGAQPPLRDGKGGVWGGTSCCPRDSGLWAVSLNSERPGNTWGQEAVSLFLSVHTWEGGGGGPRWPFRSGGRLCSQSGAMRGPRRRRLPELCSAPARSLPTTSPVDLGRVQPLHPLQPPGSRPAPASQQRP